MSWKSVADLIVDDAARPGRAPRRADGGRIGDAGPLRPRARRGAADAEAVQHLRLIDGLELGLAVHDAGDVAGQGADAGRGLRADPRRGRALHRRP